jgi:hypothetical protein
LPSAAKAGVKAPEYRAAAANRVYINGLIIDSRVGKVTFPVYRKKPQGQSSDL